MTNRKLSLMAEEWRAVPGCPELVASSQGRVARMIGHINGNGYSCVCVPFRVDGIPGASAGRKRRSDGALSFRLGTHQIIALTFLGPAPAGKTQVNHKNGVKHDNAVSNIEWCTPGANVKHAYDTGLRKKNVPYKLRKEMREQVRTDYASGMWSQEDLAEAYRVSRSTIGKALKETTCK